MELQIQIEEYNWFGIHICCKISPINAIKFLTRKFNKNKK